MATFVAIAVLIGLIFAGLGVLIPMPVFGRKRRWALLALLVVLFGGGALFQAVMTPAEKARADLDEQLKKEFAEAKRSQPKSGFTISDVSWVSDCGGFCLKLSGTLHNETNRPLKDPEIACETHAESGTELATKKRRLMKVVGAGKSVTIKGFDMGSISDDAHKIRCDVISSRST